MSARETSGQNDSITLSHDVTGSAGAAVGGPTPSSISETKDEESHLAPPPASLGKASSMGSGEGELVRLSDPRNLHSYTPHTSPAPSAPGVIPALAEVTPSTTPSSSPRRPLPCASSQPPAKRLRVEEKPSDITELRKVIVNWKKTKLESVRDKYNDHLVELFFLQRDGNMMDFQAWSRRPTRELLQYIPLHKLEGDETLEAKYTAPNPLPSGPQIKTESSSGSQSPAKSATGRTSSPVKPGKGLAAQGANARQKPPSVGDGIQTVTQQDQMVEKARQEAYVMQRIASLRKDGLWSEKRLPKVQEPPRAKAHWDYLLEEMVWLSADFAQERKWKKAAAKKCARMVQKYFQDKALQVQKAEKEQEMRLRKVAAFIAKEVRTFWGNVEKLVEYKVTTKLDEKKKMALDQQLSFIVDQTEKYSSWLAESMNKPAIEASAAAAAAAAAKAAATYSKTPSTTTDMQVSDEEFQPEEPSDDDEATIAREDDNPEEQASELQLLHEESKQSIEDLLRDLPAGYLEEGDQTRSTSTDLDSVAESHVSSEEKEERQSDKGRIPETSDNKEEKDNGSVCEQKLGRGIKRKKVKLKKGENSDDGTEKDIGDKDFEAEGSEEDNEETIEEQEEKEEGEVNHKEELEDLQVH
ncbi:Helicase domino [Chionoecetes opilio]|uniref:Helicase domino n=1 Tax=Chionoecetes opilio TaxID=41210 RepID=A0A8J4Y492_CHIOP|nr:Helicase domino [Chionoecetes opilio]